MTSSRSLLLLVALLGAGAALTQARATPLDADACGKLMVEHGALEDAGVEQNLAKGPEWAKANLSPDKIEQVRRFIELEGLILFRCRSKSRVALPPDPDEKEKEKESDKAKDKGKAEAKDEQGKDAVAQPKAPGPATKAKSDAKAKPKALPKKQDTKKQETKKQETPPPNAKSAAQEPPKSGTTTIQKSAPKAKAKVDGDDGNPFGDPFDKSAK